MHTHHIQNLLLSLYSWIVSKPTYVTFPVRDQFSHKPAKVGLTALFFIRCSTIQKLQRVESWETMQLEPSTTRQAATGEELNCLPVEQRCTANSQFIRYKLISRVSKCCKLHQWYAFSGSVHALFESDSSTLPDSSTTSVCCGLLF